MFLTVSKRLEFSASRRLFVPEWSAAENIAAFGPEAAARYGTGRNYVAYFVFSGEVNQANGMLMNISEIKHRVGRILHAGFDHKFLNEDNPAFAHRPPTAENIARQLFADAAPLFEDSDAQLIACHLSESEAESATYYANGISEANAWFEFSAARQTMSPHLSVAENNALFGVAASPHGHGHHYRARLTMRNPSGAGAAAPRAEIIQNSIESLRTELDHKNLNHEVAGLIDRPITTESLSAYVCERARARLPVHRVRLFERRDFFAEHWQNGDYFLGMQMAFSAAHRLHSAVLSDEENVALYGKCNNAKGHGHRYVTEATVDGRYDELSGTLGNFSEMRNAVDSALDLWRDKHLDLETEEFRSTPSTGENIVQALWPKFDAALQGRLTRLRLWETPNNRFTLRQA